MEELPGQAVVARGSSRPQLGGILAVVAVGILVAVGVGALGGRRDSSPAATTSASQSRPPTSRTPIPVEPLVTPWTSCTAGPTKGPELSLVIDGVGNPGRVELVESPADLESTAGSTPPSFEPSESAGRVEVRTDALTQLWVTNGVCAVEWTIGLLGLEVLEQFENPQLDAAVAAQNRFDLAFRPDLGGDFDLVADLRFPEVSLRGTWPIRLVRLPRPQAELRWGGRDIPLVEGCDLTLWVRFREFRLNECETSLSADAPDPITVSTARDPSFSIPGWPIDGVDEILCGGVDNRYFVSQPGPICEFETVVDSGVATFRYVALRPVPISGAWLVAISGCGTSHPTGGAAQVCGTWYANLRFR